MKKQAAKLRRKFLAMVAFRKEEFQRILPAYSPLSLFGLLLLSLTNSLHAQESGSNQACSNEIFTVVENPPAYQGGIEQLAADLNARLDFAKNVKEEAVVKALINCDGLLSLVGPFDPIGSSPFSQTAMAIYELQHWQAGRQRSRAVDCYYSLRIKIKKGKLQIVE